MSSLLVLKGPNQGQRIKLDRDRIVIGRNPDCDVVIPGNAVSRQHALILRESGQFFLEDLQSRNKTYVNSQPVDGRVPLNDRDRIKICDFLCTFHLSSFLPLPEELRKEEENAEEDDGATSTVMSTMDVSSSQNVLIQTQPAEKLKVLLEITNSLTKTLELEPLLPKILDNLFQIFKQADRGFIVLRQEPNKVLVPKAVKTRRERDETTTRFSRGIVNQCIDNAQAILSKDASTDQRFGNSQSISDFRIRSVMCAPLRAQDGKVLGVIQLDTQDRTKEFNQDDLQLLVAISNQAAVAFENASLHEAKLDRDRHDREMKFAKEVQRGFLPHQEPRVEGYEFFAHYEAANEVGGDFYSFVPLPNQRWAIAIGDVAGKGVPAALLMAKVSSDVRSCFLTEPDPARAMTQLNGLLLQAGLVDRFVTMVVVVVDVVRHHVTVVNAGHLVPLLRRAGTGMLEEIGGEELSGLPLGVMETFEYRSVETDLKPGDCMLLCTDGVIDAVNPKEELFGTDRLLDSTKSGPPSAVLLGKHVLKAVDLHSVDMPNSDDLTLVCFGRSPQAT
jgi:serine phosphatase RsbU (regulator of sigma subunit)/pSer/pThr/pTyr-binding forkhead associated (FHA) protein